MIDIIKNLNFVNLGWQIFTPLIFMLIDIITGYIQSLINKTTDSSIMREGLMHKCLLIIIIFLGFIIEFAFSLKAVSIAICMYIVVMELTSILENLKKAGINLQILEYFDKGGKK